MSNVKTLMGFSGTAIFNYHSNSKKPKWEDVFRSALDSNIGSHPNVLDGLSFYKEKFEGKLISRDRSLQFRHCSFDKCDFSGCGIDGVRFDHCDFTNCVFRKCVFKESAIGSCHLSYTNFFDSQFHDIEADRNMITQCMFRNVKLIGTSQMKFNSFEGALIEDSDFRNCNFHGSTFHKATMRRVDLTGSILPPPGVMLNMQFHFIPDKKLTRELIMWDASNHPDPRRFDRWPGDYGTCPYDDILISRASHFQEDDTLWKKGQKIVIPNPYKLMMKVFKHFGIKWDPVKTPTSARF